MEGWGSCSGRVRASSRPSCQRAEGPSPLPCTALPPPLAARLALRALERRWILRGSPCTEEATAHLQFSSLGNRLAILTRILHVRGASWRELHQPTGERGNSGGHNSDPGSPSLRPLSPATRHLPIGFFVCFLFFVMELSTAHYQFVVPSFPNQFNFPDCGFI